MIQFRIPTEEEVGRRFEEARKKRKLDRGAVIKELGEGCSGLREVEAGRQRPSYLMLVKCAARYGASVDYLLALTDEDRTAREAECTADEVADEADEPEDTGDGSRHANGDLFEAAKDVVLRFNRLQKPYMFPVPVPELVADLAADMERLHRATVYAAGGLLALEDL